MTKLKNEINAFIGSKLEKNIYLVAAVIYFTLSTILIGPLSELDISPILLKRFVKVIGVCCFLIFAITKLDILKSKKAFTPLILFVTGAILAVLVHDGYTALNFISPISSFGIALLLVFQDLENFLKKLFYINCGIYLLLLFVGFHPDFTPLIISQNGIVTTLFSLLLALIVASVKNNKTILDLSPSFILFILVSFTSSGRSNFIIATITLFYFLYNCFKNKDKKQAIITAVCVIFIMTFPFGWKYAFISKSLKENYNRIYEISHQFLGIDFVELTALNSDFLGGRDSTDEGLMLGSLPYFRQKSLKSPRFKIWKTYFSSLNVKRFLFGGIDIESKWMNIRFKGVYKKFNYNFHNSFLRSHKYGGLLAVLASILMLFWLFKSGFSQYVNFITVLFILRMGLDEFVYYSLYTSPLIALGIYRHVHARPKEAMT